ASRSRRARRKSGKTRGRAAPSSGPPFARQQRNEPRPRPLPGTDNRLSRRNGSMRKAFVCVLLGMVLGIVMGVGLLFLQMKYGSAPVVCCEATASQDEPSSCLATPKPLEPTADEGDAATDEPPAAEKPIRQRWAPTEPR